MPEGQEGNDRLFVAGGQAAALLEAAKKAFDFVAVAAGLCVHRPGFGSARVAGNHGFNPVFSAIGAGFVAIVGCVSQHFSRPQARQQGQGLRAVASLCRRGNQAHGVAQGLDAGMDCGAPAAAAAPEALGFGGAFFGPAFFGPAECGCARSAVASSMTQSNSGAFKASNKFSQTPFWASRRKRRQTEVDLPKRSSRPTAPRSA